VLFNSIVFIFIFLPITYFVFWRLKTKTSRYVWLTITGYVFYGWWNPKFCLLMLFSTLVSYFAGVYILNTPSRALQKRAMILSVVVDLALLGFFKYYGFFAENLNGLGVFFSGSTSGSGAVLLHLPLLKIILPVGISFYTFHTMSYIIDAYRGTIKPTRNFFEFSCYVSLFSQLVAGPIVRFRQIEADLENIDHSSRLTNINEGLSFFLLGLFKKVLIADSLAAFIDPAFKLGVSQLSTVGAWELILGYTYQLYFDFSGYSDMAVGLGYLFGIRIPQNFNSPYKACDISEFWRRWHISLSTWLRDYLYISLGGNRSSIWRTRTNLMITMLLGGLWHGANWTFLAWGALHGMYLVIHQTWKTFSKFRLPNFAAQILTFISVVIGWVYFRSPTIGDAHLILQKMFFWQTATGGRAPFGLFGQALPSKLTHNSFAFIFFLMLAAGVAHLSPNTFEINHTKPQPLAVFAYTLLFVVCIFRILVNENTPFLYFQF
jgi:alginate O-acetyltransferase complex protein AlgI